MDPRTFSNMISSMLYERRCCSHRSGGGVFSMLAFFLRRFGPWFCEPVIVGLEGEENKPFLSAMVGVVTLPLFLPASGSRPCSTAAGWGLGRAHC